MSRTDELRKGGAKERGGSGGGGTPFVKWGENYAWIEGSVTTLWEGKYGMSATMTVTSISSGLQAAGKDEDGEKYIRRVEVGEEVNVGLNYAALKDAIVKDDEGKHFHVAFEGWAESKTGDKYRVFAVLEVPEKDGLAVPGKNVPSAAQVRAAAGGDDDLPFAPMRLLTPWL